MPARGSLQTLARLGRRGRRAAPAEPVAVPASAEALPALFASIGIDRNYEALDFEGLSVDLHGWWGVNPVFEQVFRELRPAIVIEVGSWRGGSVLYMQELSRRHDCGTRFICVDTWLGSNDSLWLDPDYIRAVDAFRSAHGLELRVEGTQWLLFKPPMRRSRRLG